jgi:hypothetical protein
MEEIIVGESHFIETAQERTASILRHIQYKLTTRFQLDLGEDLTFEVGQFILDEVFSAMIDAADKAIHDPVNHQRIIRKTSRKIGE